MVETYIGTVTQKGQVTIPLPIRKRLGVKPYSKVLFSIDKKGVKIDADPDISNLAGFIKAPKGKDALKARKYMESHYERV